MLVTPGGVIVALRPGRASAQVRVGKVTWSVPVEVQPWDSTKVRFIAHRGLGSIYPENTLTAFALAVAAGADAIEFDLHISRDGEFVVIHDETVDRTTNGRGRVASMTIAELSALDACPNHPAYRPCPVPTLLEALAIVERLGTRAVLDIKVPLSRERAAQLVTQVRRAGVADRVMLQHPDPGVLALFRQLAPEMALSRLVLDWQPLSQFQQLPTAAVMPLAAALAAGAGFKEFVGASLAAGVQPIAWTIYLRSELEAAIKAGFRSFMMTALPPR